MASAESVGTVIQIRCKESSAPRVNPRARCAIWAGTIFMIYGRHTDLVQEVVDFVLQGNVLKYRFRRESVLGTPVHVIKSLDEVGRFRDGGHPRAEIDKSYTWHDMVMGDFESVADSADPPLDDDWYRTILGSIQSAVLKMHDRLEEQFLVDRDLRGLDAGYVVSGLSAAAVVRSIQGIGDSLSERMFQVYKAYGYPCGWRGDSETGSLVVYSK